MMRIHVHMNEIEAIIDGVGAKPLDRREKRPYEPVVRHLRQATRARSRSALVMIHEKRVPNPGGRIGREITNEELLTPPPRMPSKRQFISAAPVPLSRSCDSAVIYGAERSTWTPQV